MIEPFGKVICNPSADATAPSVPTGMFGPVQRLRNLQDEDPTCCEENTSLRQEVQVLTDEQGQLVMENERLKQDIQTVQGALQDCLSIKIDDEFARLRQENERLRSLFWECPKCGFEMHQQHFDEKQAEPCPCCAETKLRSLLEKKNAALELIEKDWYRKGDWEVAEIAREARSL